jgi:hypothetical protein
MFCFAGLKKDATDFCIEKAFPFCLTKEVSFVYRNGSND